MDEITPVRRAEMSPKQNSATIKQAITPTHLLAHMINPKYMGQRLSCEQQEEARSLLILLNASILPQLYQFQAKAASFPASIFECTDALDPVTWLKTIKTSKTK